MAQAKKKARTEELLAARCASVSDSAFSRVLQQVNLHPILLELTDARRQLQQPVAQQFNETCVTLQLPLISGGNLPWRVLDLGKALRLFVSKSVAYKELMHKTTRQHGHTLHVLIVHDEIAAGNVLRSDNRRKFTPFYLAFSEFELALQNEYSWIPLAIITHGDVSLVAGGMSAVVRVLLRSLMLGETSAAIQGIVLPLDAPTLLFIRLSPLLLDEAAVKSTFDCKGAAGLRPCLSCKNVVATNADLARHDATGYLVDIAEVDSRKFDLSSNNDIWEVLDNLSAQQPFLNVGQMDTLCKASGFNINKDGLLWDRDLRPWLPYPLQRWDGMHCLFSHGVASTEMVVFLDACKRKVKVTFKDLEAFCCAAWMNQPGRNVDFKTIFSSKREKYTSQDSAWKGTASDLMGVFPLIREFVERVVKPTNLMNEEVASFIAMADVVRVYRRMKRSARVTDAACDQLRDALISHGTLHKQAYGNEFIKPKFHFVRHLPDQLRLMTTLVDCFTAERKHKMAKAVAQPINNFSDFGVAVLSRCIANQIVSMPESFVANHLIRPVCDSPDTASMLNVPSAKLSMAMRVHHSLVSINDVIIAGGTAMKVRGCVQTDTLLLLVVVFHSAGTLGSGQVWTQTAPTIRTIDVSLLVDFLEPSFWTYIDPQTVLTLE